MLGMFATGCDAVGKPSRPSRQGHSTGPGGPARPHRRWTLERRADGPHRGGDSQGRTTWPGRTAGGMGGHVMRSRIVAVVTAITLGLGMVGSTSASADQSSRTYRGHWTTSTAVCAGALTPEGTVSAWGQYVLTVKRDGQGTFTFDYHDPYRVAKGSHAVQVITRDPLTLTGIFHSVNSGDLVMNTTVSRDRIVIAATTSFTCDTAGHVLTIVYTGIVR
jgi:hypothetical protein